MSKCKVEQSEVYKLVNTIIFFEIFILADRAGSFWSTSEKWLAELKRCPLEARLLAPLLAISFLVQCGQNAFGRLYTAAHLCAPKLSIGQM
jgi:hypothetical protein